MLTLQQLLESDSLATIVAKLNQNFQSLSLSNGGPQGIIGKQGIPGLPGRVGPMGVTGPEGPTGTIAGIIPFSAIPGTGTTAGPDPTITDVSSYGTVGPWPQSSWQWLKEYYSNGVTIYGVPHVGGSTPKPGDIFIDHANKGYWKFLNQPDLPGAHDDTAIPPYSEGGAYSSTGLGSTYPSLGQQLGWVGPGWYYYPPGNTTAESLNNVWINDTSTYLLSNLQTGTTGPYRVGPNPSNDQTLSVPNARLISKYGTVWITSGNDPLVDLDDQENETSTIGKWGYGSGLTYSQPARNNSGIDRLLFKMSLDGLPYLSNVAARGLVTGEDIIISPDVTYPSNTLGDQMITKNFWVSPYNSVSLEKFAPLLFLSHRNDDVQGSDGTYGSLGIYMYTDTTTKDDTVPAIQAGLYGPGTTVRNNNISKTLHLFTSRYSIDPISMFPGGGRTPIKSNSTRNFGEMILDFRRIVASNQYVCSLPTDLKLSSDFLAGNAPGAGNADTRYYDENNGSNTFKYKTNQGYISSINGKAITGLTTTADFWEYGLGTDAPGLSGYSTGTHDSTSGTLGMRTRRSWYGSSVTQNKPSTWETSPVNSTDLIRVAGMMERGRRVKWDENSGNYNKTAFLSELIFYSSAFSLTNSSLINGVGVTNDVVNPSINAHKSLPSLYVSPYTNIGIGTFVGGYLATNDQGPQEPAAKLHVHLKETTGLDDYTKTFISLNAGAGVYANLPTKTYAVAAFSGTVNPSIKKGNIDILLGALASTATENASRYEDPVNSMIGTGNQLRNAIRSESWAGTNFYTENLSTLRLGAQPYAASNAIGRSIVSAFRNEFQISLHPLNVRSTDLTSSLTSISGVGIHNMYPRARVHFFGNNTYNETEYGVQAWRPGYMSSSAGATFPYYGASSVNSASANQVVIDYIGDSYKYPVGLYEYQYYVYGLLDNNPISTGSTSPNSAVYPNKEILSPTRFAVPYGSNQFYNQSYPSAIPTVAFNNSYKHGGTENAWWEPSSFIGFNLYRDLSSADGNTLGDNRESTKWILGTQGTDGRNHGNNGGAGIISSNTGELGIITIPRGRDGGRAYEEWEQRGLGTRDVLNHMKIVFDKNGNIAIGNAAGWDLDAYPSVNNNMITGYVNYLSSINNTLGINAINFGPLDALNVLSTRNKFASLSYTSLNSTIYAETPGLSSASLINKRATLPEYIRLEVGAEKGWSRDGRMIQKLGFGYPANVTITIPFTSLAKYVRNSYSITPIANQSSWAFTTDAEGRIVNNEFIFRIAPTNPSLAPTPIASDFIAVFPHPTEFSTGGPLSSVSGVPVNFVAQTGAMAAEWWGMSTDSPVFNNSVLTTAGINTGASRSGWRVSFIPTTDTKGSANVRLNNFIYGEGFGFSDNSQVSTGNANPSTETTYTKNLIRQKRQESPRLILSFLERTPNTWEAANRPDSGVDPYLKVNTIIASAQNESAMREYWIPKTDNTGGTFMVFTDHFGKKEKDTGFDEESIVIKQLTPDDESTRVGLHLEEVVTQEFLAGYKQKQFITRGTLSTTLDKNEEGRPKNLFPGYVRYYNKSYNVPGQPESFISSQFGETVRVAPGFGSSSSYDTLSQTQSAQLTSKKTKYKLAALKSGSGPTPPVLISGYSDFEVFDSVIWNYDCADGGSNSDYNDWKMGFGNQTSATMVTYMLGNINTTKSLTTSNAAVAYVDGATRQAIVLVGPGSYRLDLSASSPFRGALAKDVVNYCGGGDDDKSEYDVNRKWEMNATLYNSSGVAQTASATMNYTSATKTQSQLFTSTGANWYIKIEQRNSGHGVITADVGSCGCSTSSTRAKYTNHKYGGKATLALYDLRVGCSNVPDKTTLAYISLGGGSSDFRLQKPKNDSLYPCKGHTFYNVYDTDMGLNGTSYGSVANYDDTGNQIVFYPNLNGVSYTTPPKGVKINIKLNAKTPRFPTEDTNYQWYKYRSLLLSLVPNTGSQISDTEFSSGGFDNMYVQLGNSIAEAKFAIFNGFLGTDQDQYTYQPTDGPVEPIKTWTYNGEGEIYLSWNTWENYRVNGFVLAGAQFQQFSSSAGYSLLGDNNLDWVGGGSLTPWTFDYMDVEFELIYDSSQAVITENTLEPNLASGDIADFASIRRNVDKFYSIFSPTTNYDNGWNTTGGSNNAPLINNLASSIRMKRINSEFALVDYNITVKVDNPIIQTEPTWEDDGGAVFIDMCSPRFTQYLRFTYVPDEAFWEESEFDQNIAHDLYGNGMWFSNWSSYKNWLPGTAIVGDDINNGTNGELGEFNNYDFDNFGGAVGQMPRNTASDWSPSFFDTGSNNGLFSRTWNGNLLQMLSFKPQGYPWFEAPIARNSSQFTLLTDPLKFSEPNSQTEGGAYAAFGADRRMLQIASVVFNLTNGSAGDLKATKQKSFVGYLGAMYALWGNQSFERNTNVQWRMTPRYNFIDNSVQTDRQTNNSFSLEVQFSKPILHVDTPIGIGIFGNTGDTQGTVEPYRYLTVSGQGIVRYAQTNRN